MLKFDDGQQRTLRKLPIYGAAAIPVATIEILLSTTHTRQDKNLSVHFIDVFDVHLRLIEWTLNQKHR